MNDPAPTAPFRLVMYCPCCGKLHVDRGEWATRRHKTHRCVTDDLGEGCGSEWKPSEYPTVGVLTLQDTMYLPGDEKPDDPSRPHIVGGEFQSDKYPSCPRGKVPLSTKDPSAQPLLWAYAQHHRAVDAKFSDDLEWALRKHGFVPSHWVPTDDGTGDDRSKLDPVHPRSRDEEGFGPR